MIDFALYLSLNPWSTKLAVDKEIELVLSLLTADKEIELVLSNLNNSVGYELYENMKKRTNERCNIDVMNL